jgi:uncharacterized protein YndB with AHSA1/START domain
MTRRTFTTMPLIGAALLAAATAAHAAQPATMQDDLSHRSPHIHWPDGFDPATADLFAHNETHVYASCERVWSYIVDAEKWPRWYPNAADVHLVDGGMGQLAEGSVFRWTTFGLKIESRIHEFVPRSRIGWYGYAPGSAPAFYHTWYLTPADGGCHVIMEEVGKGADAAGLRRKDEGLMHHGHDVWLVTLKWMAENH